jgi:hypothetical protein
MPRVGFETTIPVFERAKTVHALDRAVTLIGDDADDSSNSVNRKRLNPLIQLFHFPAVQSVQTCTPVCSSFS